MPKKKQPRNAFYFFMLDYKARCERNGEKFPNGLRDVQIEAGPEWDIMPPSAKKKYEDMAKQEKAKIKGNTAHKETCLHNSFYSVDRRKAAEEEEKSNMNTFIENTMQYLSVEGKLAQQSFYLIHVNHFCVSEGECYHPAEIAISEFSLSQGVTRVYHTIVNPGTIPLGYRHDAQTKSDATHKIPINNDGEKSFYKILCDIKAFLKPGKPDGFQYQPLYTMADNVSLNTSISAVRSVIDHLGTSSSTEDYEFTHCKVYSLEKLYLELQQACSRFAEQDDCSEVITFPNLSVARNELEKDVYNYSTEACDFHIKEDAVEYCSESYVKRWAYLICDNCCQFLNIQLVHGRHIPEESDVNYRKNVKMQEQKNMQQEPKPFTFVDHSKMPSAKWVPVEQPPLPKPVRQANLVAMSIPQQRASMMDSLSTGLQGIEISQAHENIDISDENFPSISIGRGRGGMGRGALRGNKAMSFAAAMKNKK